MEGAVNRRMELYRTLNDMMEKTARRVALEVIKEYVPTTRKSNGTVVAKHAVSETKPIYPRWNPRSMALYRQKNRLSRTQLGAMLGCSAYTVGSWEAGRTRPSADYLARFRNLEEGRDLGERSRVAVPRPEPVRRGPGRPPNPRPAPEEERVQYQRAYQAKRRAERKAAGICSRCLRPVMRPGMTLCEKHAVANRKDQARYYDRKMGRKPRYVKEPVAPPIPDPEHVSDPVPVDHTPPDYEMGSERGESVEG